METTAQASPARKPKPTRSLRLHLSPTQEKPGVLSITVGQTVDVYYLSETGSEIGGRGFRLEKLALSTSGDPVVMERYFLHVGEGSTMCECKGFLRWGYCKHTEAVAKLIDLGRI